MTVSSGGPLRAPAAQTLHLGEGLDFPLDAVTETFAFLAKRRAGKSNAAVVFAEELFDSGQPWVAIDPKGDWWGVRASGDGQAPGLAVVVFGGLHADVPLESTAGRLVARLVAEQRLTCVLDVSEMTKTDQRRFLADFAEELYRRNREPLHVFAEEADDYLPQLVRSADARLVGAWETLIKRGGFRGIGVSILSQRSASLNKDALSQIETLICLRTPSPHDRKAILGWVAQHETGAEAVADLPSLADGEAWVFSPQWLGSLTKTKFRRRRTFDSGSTPKVGGKPRPPATLATVDLAAIQAAMAETIERVDQDDPKALRRRVTTLERELATARSTSQTTQRVVEQIEISVLTPEALRELTAVVERLEAAYATHLEALERSAAQTVTSRDELTRLRAVLVQLSQQGGAAVVRPSVAPHPVTTPPPRPTRTRVSEPPPVAGDAPAQLRKGARRMVEALGRMAPLRLTKSQWGTVARLKTSGGTWSTYLSDLRRHGLVDEGPTGYTLTDAGFAYLGVRPEPMGADELQAHYRSILRSGAKKMLDQLIAHYPQGLTRDELGAAADLAVTGGTFSTYLSDLVRNGLAQRDGDVYLATDVLMHGANLEP